MIIIMDVAFILVPHRLNVLMFTVIKRCIRGFMYLYVICPFS